MGKTEDRYVVTLIASRGADTRNLGTWDAFDGGGTTSDSQKYRRGGMQPAEALGGPQDVDDITCERLYDEFMQELTPWLRAGVGSADISVTKQPLDANRNTFGRPEVFTGKISSFTPPSHDSQSSDPARCVLVVSPNGTVG